MSKLTAAYERGRAAGAIAGPTLAKWMEAIAGWARMSYPASVHLDYWDECVKLDRERLAAVPSLTKFPELKGWPDIIREERRGFQEASGCGPRELAYQYTWFFFCSRRLNTRFVGSGDRAHHCTAVYIRDSKEGGPLFGHNTDDIRRPGLENFPPPAKGPDGKRRLILGSVSSAVLCDEEPTEIFPVDVWQVLPPDCQQTKDIIAFLQRYNEFWGPCNGIVVDKDQTGVAYEKSNCRMGVRWSEDGTAAVTACSYLIPEMKKFKEERGRRSLVVRGWTEDCPDWVYWQGCDARYQRLLKLTCEASARGATLTDLTAIVTDHAVPFPERICLAGEKGHPDDQDVNFTLTSDASVLEGPNRRTLFWRVEGNQACYANPPFLVLGDGVTAKPEWQRGTRTA